MIGLDAAFDAPLFKVLANNDTGAASGHQGGVVIPRDLVKYFPALIREVTQAEPTVEQWVTAELWLEGQRLETVETRFQLQTWGGKRRPEYRLTGNLTSIRNQAKGGDLLLIERSQSDSEHYRLTLVRAGTAQHGNILALVGDRRWGPLNTTLPPVEEEVVINATLDIEAASLGAFALFDDKAKRIESTTLRVARSRAFRTVVTRAYEARCAFCGVGLRTPHGRFEVEAAHIVPRTRHGSDDVRNGLALCRTHHWAFDLGLWGISDEYRLLVAQPAMLQEANASLAQRNGSNMILPSSDSHFPSLEAIKWHRENTLI